MIEHRVYACGSPQHEEALLCVFHNVSPLYIDAEFALCPKCYCAYHSEDERHEIYYPYHSFHIKR